MLKKKLTNLIDQTELNNTYQKKNKIVNYITIINK